MTPFDYVLVGGGLQSGLLALALSRHRPSARVAVVEAGDRLCGNHTWSFHTADVPPGAEGLVDPLVVATWPQYEVRFHGHARVMPSRYSTITSERFDTVVRRTIQERGWDLRLLSPAVQVTADGVTLASGEELSARCVVDSRGPRPTRHGCGYQKFLGLEVETTSPWPDRHPVVMDSAVPQDDGFHFVYTLPLTPTRVLVEDTYFSDTPELDPAHAKRQVESYVGKRVSGWRVMREESGVLPMPWQPPPKRTGTGPLVGGYAGGWFHPATGYSFPVALRFAIAIAAVPPEEAMAAAARLARQLSPRWQFARFLNRLLFQFVPPDSRWQVFARLYRALPPAVLARFYAMEFTAADAARIVVGRPPRIDLLRPLRRPGSKSWLSLSPR